MPTPTQLTQALHEASNQDRFDDLMAAVADDIEVVNYSNGFMAQGKESFRQFFMGFKTAFPDLTITHRNVVAAGDQVAVEFGAVGTHTGPLMTPNGAVAPTGRVVHFNVVEFHTWKGGKLTRLVNYQDALSLMGQLGLLPQAAGL